MIEFGICNPISNHAVASAQGCDFIECGVAQLLPAQPDSDDEVKARMAEFEASSLPVQAFSGFIPPELKVTGPDVDWQRVSDYVSTALRRASAAGARIVVWGSGGSRNVPDGFDRELAKDQVIRFLHLAGHWAARNDITIAIEPLNLKESNIVNSVGEGVFYAERVAHSHVRVLADFYHMDEDDEPLDAIFQYGPWLRHIHVADTGRLHPGSGSYPYADFVKQVSRADYDGMISVECRWGDDLEGEVGRSMEFLRSLWPDQKPEGPDDSQTEEAPARAED